jgi:hypothetical protein
MSLFALTWDSFQALPPDAETASVSRFCLFSLATLELARRPGTTDFALIEQQNPNVWRWAVVSSDGFLIDAGSEPTHDYAKKAVERALHLELA